MQAARLAWLDSDQTEPYEAYLDRAMGTVDTAPARPESPESVR